MRPFYEQINNLPDRSYFIREQPAPFLDMPYHYHPELELTYNLDIPGKRFIGNSVERMEQDEVIFIGKNLPHAFLSDPDLENHPDRAKGYTIVLQFKFDLFEQSLAKMPEMKSVFKLLEKSQRGLSLQGATKSIITQKMRDLVVADELQAVQIILEILFRLAQTEEYRLLSSKGFIKEYHTPDYHRMNAVYNYIIEHFKEDIKLSDVASVANLTETAFCRFFKKRTLKTFSQVVNEMRISYACSLLQVDLDDINTISQKAGFNNLSNFNRQFKKITGNTPLGYRKSFG